jgi:NADH-quinone oxidoreductase subunit C
MVKKHSDLVKNLKNKFKGKIIIQNEKRIWITIDSSDLIEICKWISKQGFVHLSAISVTDWLEKKEYELTYHLWSYDEKKLVTLKTKINRDKPEINSVVDIWTESAQIHERELHELFGVKFIGNNDLAPLFLEDWKGPAPFKKDFNWRTYVREEFYKKENERERVYYD